MMIYYFGTLTDERKKQWNNGEQNPYNVVKENIKVSDSFYYQKCFKDEIWIDWGSRASRISGKELLEEMRKNGDNGNTLKRLVIKEDEEYGFVEIGD